MMPVAVRERLACNVLGKENPIAYSPVADV